MAVRVAGNGATPSRASSTRSLREPQVGCCARSRSTAVSPGACALDCGGGAASGPPSPRRPPSHVATCSPWGPRSRSATQLPPVRPRLAGQSHKLGPLSHPSLRRHILVLLRTAPLCKPCPRRVSGSDRGEGWGEGSPPSFWRKPESSPVKTGGALESWRRGQACVALTSLCKGLPRRESIPASQPKHRGRPPAPSLRTALKIVDKSPTS